MSGRNGAAEALMTSTLQHLGMLLELYRPMLPPGQKIEFVTDGYRISIEQRIVIAPAGLVPRDATQG